MGKKLTKVDFARIWGEVSRLSEKDWTAMCVLRGQQGRDKEAITVPRTRKPKPEAGEKDHAS